VSITPPPIPRFGHGSRVPGWDDAVDLTKDPATVPDPATTPVPPELRDDIETAMAKYPDRRSAAIPALHAAQKLHGWCSPEAIDQVATVMQLTPAYLTSVATFYDMFSTVPKPRHDVFVCTNITCSLLGADEFFEAMTEAAEHADDVGVRSFECLGACDIAPMASVNGVYVGPLELDDAKRIVEDLHAERAVLDHKQLRYRRSADPIGTGTAAPDGGASIGTGTAAPDGGASIGTGTAAPDGGASGVAEEETDFGPPDPATTEMADTAGLGPQGDTEDRPGPPAAIEMTDAQLVEHPEPDKATDEDEHPAGQEDPE
jgi:NADH-quinone oxidoreductase subunit E